MRGAWQFWLFLLVLVVLHFVLHLALGFGLGAPDLLTVAVLLGARRLSGAGAAGLGFGLGLLQDSLSLVAFGREALTYTLLGFGGARSRDLFVGDSLLFLGLYLFLGKWLHDLIFWIAAPATRGSAVEDLLIHAPIAGIYAAAVGVVLTLLYRGVSSER